MSSAKILNILQYANASANFSLDHHSVIRRHISYVSFGDIETCHRHFEQNMSHQSNCEYVTKTSSCRDLVNFFDYLKFLICTLHLGGSIWGHVEICLTMLAVVIFITSFLFIISKYFILPNVIHVAHYIHMPLYEYGLTIISVILTAPDVLWVMHDCKKVSQNGTLLLAHMLGKAFTCFIVGIGVICLHKNVKIPGTSFVTHTIIAIVVFVYSEQMITKKSINDNAPLAEQRKINVRAHAFLVVVIYLALISYIILTKRRHDRETPPPTRYPHRLTTYAKKNGMGQLLAALNPFEHMHVSKIWIILSVPLWLLAALQIPVIDKHRPMFGWCKYLTCLNVLIFPWQVWFLKTFHSDALFIGVTFACIVVVIVTMITTNIHEPPQFQGFYAVTGILFGLSSYQVIGAELESILWQVSSYVFNMPRDMIMLTGFVFNYLLNVVIFSYELAMMGYGHLACGVIMGIVVNQAFLILPIIVFQYCFDLQNLVAVSANTSTCYVFMLIGFVITILCVSVTNFRLRFTQGIFLVTLYAIFILYLMLSWMGVIHPYGGFHSVAVEFKREDSRWA